MNHLLIVSLSRSGGKLLRMLLDGHPAFNVFPFEHWNRSAKGKIPTRQMEAFDRLSVDDKLATAGAAHLERKLLHVHPEAGVAVMQAWRVEAAGAATLAAMYESLARAYFTALGAANDAMVVNHCGSLCRFTRDQLDAVFGKGQHLLTIRDPRAVFTSMQGLRDRQFTAERIQKGKVSAAAVERHVERLEAIDSATGYLREFCHDYRNMVAHYAACPDVIRIRFEDLVTSPEATMRRLATTLAIRWDPTLLAPTRLGISHAPNSSFTRPGNGIHDRAANDWVDRLAPSVRSYIEETLTEEMAALGYQRLDRGGRTVLDSAPMLEG
jgi:Sulfotransferase family